MRNSYFNIKKNYSKFALWNVIQRFSHHFGTPQIMLKTSKSFSSILSTPCKVEKTYFHYISVGVTLVKRSIWFLQFLSFIILIFRIYLWQLNLFKLKQTYCEFLTLLIFLVACYTFVVAIFIIHITFSSINLLLTCDIINTDTYDHVDLTLLRLSTLKYFTYETI